jgi:hypothetical protein
MHLRIGYRLLAGAVVVLALAACAAPGPTGEITSTPEVAPETEAAAGADRTVSAGMQTDFFDPYTILVAEGWIDTRKSDASAPFDALTLIKGDYSILIGQGGGDGLMCLFGGVPTPIGEAHLWLEFASGVRIANSTVELMRGSSDGVSHTVCEKSGEDYSTWTSFGSITYTTPSPADDGMLAEMDAMVGSLKK